MAYAALVSLAHTLENILNHDQYSAFVQEKSQFQYLHEHVIFLQEFLEDSPEKASNVEGGIRDVANEAEDILECLMCEQIHSLKLNRKTSGGLRKYTRINNRITFQARDSSPHQSGMYVPHTHQAMFQRQCQKLPKVIEDIDSIVEDVMKIQNSLRIQDLQLSDSSPPNSSSMQLSESSPPSSSSMPVPIEKDLMIGFDDDLMAVKTRLCGESSKLEVIPIFGMGGIGKTTLARNAFDDPLTMQKFEIRAWVTVSQDYNIQQILSSLLNSIKGFNETLHGYELMAEHVYKSLKGRKYLIVMDDMWSTKAWDDVRRLFPDDQNGSRIILTTRLSDVAAYVDSSSPLHELRFMDMVQSWNLLQQKVFKHVHCAPELENIGKKIARSCGGLPLAIVVVAGLLSTISPTKASWENIAENVKNLAVTANDEQFAKILTLSYTHLPHHLRLCFLYMGGFPEDYEIHISKLIRLWVAEGFMKPSVSKSFEEGAEEYLEDLVKRSLVLVNRRKSSGKIKSCSIHDMLRDLCIRKAQEENFLVHLHKTLPSNTKIRRVSINPSSNLALLANIDSLTIRTMLYFQNSARLLSSFASFRWLRVLEAVKLEFKSFPAKVLELIHLRYLAFTYNHIIGKYFDIPASILKLQNLQTFLIIPYWTSDKKIIRFPLEIWRMPQLRHLVLGNLNPLPYPFATSSALENLQTLTLVTNFECTEWILQLIPNLKKLSIIYDKNRLGWPVYHLHNLVCLRHLEKLSIWIEKFKYFALSLWEMLAFPMTLKKLKLRGCRFRPQDMEIVGSLTNLEVLKLRDCHYEDGKWETTEGQFPQLKFLQIIRTNLQHWITESSHFPRLERLVLSDCFCLGEIPDVIGEIPTLQLIEVGPTLGDKSLLESAKRIKEEQQSFGNDSLQVRCMWM